MGARRLRLMMVTMSHPVLRIALQGPADGVRTGQDGAAFAPGGRRTADALHLLDDGLDGYARAESKGDHAAHRFGLACGAPAGLAHGREDLADPFFVFVDVYLE